MELLSYVLAPYWTFATFQTLIAIENKKKFQNKKI
jgi:hypothetical protein